MGNMNVSGLHRFQNVQNSGQFVAAPRTFNPDGTPVRLMVLDEEDLENLATFGKVTNKGGAAIKMEGDHSIKALKNEKKGQIMFDDNKKGKAAKVEKTQNEGDISVSGNHAFKEIENKNGGKVIAKDRKFPDAKKMVLINLDEDIDLEDLATFGNFSNAKGGNAAFTGDHQVKNMNNAKGGNVQLKDHKKGQKTVIQNTNNAGNMMIQGMHHLENVTNQG